MANKIERYIIEKSNSFFKNRYERYFLKELRGIESKSEVPIIELTLQQKKEIQEYYASKGFTGIKTDWHQYIYSTTQRWSPKMVPDDFYHLILERIYNDKEINGWEDKAYMSMFLPDVLFPTTLIANINGYYLNEQRQIVSMDEAKSIVLAEGRAFVKPSLQSGGGRNAMLVTEANIDEVFKMLNKNYVVQRIIKQHKETAAFNPSSVNTEKILSFLYKGEVFILSAHMRVGAPDSFTDNASGGKGYTFGIKPDGSIEPIAMNVFGKKRDTDYFGNSLSGRTLSYHKDICEIIKKAHKRLPYFGFVSWDFCVTEKGEPLLIEYNTSNAEVLVYQMTSGPLFGDMLDDVLADARKHSNFIKYTRF